MITGIRFTGFRGVPQLDIGDLAQLNVIVGGNGSGKTSLLEGLFLLCSSGSPRDVLTVIEHLRGVPNFRPVDVERQLRWLVHRGSGTAELSGTFRTGAVRKASFAIQERGASNPLTLPDGGFAPTTSARFGVTHGRDAVEGELYVGAGGTSMAPEQLLPEPSQIPVRIAGVGAHRGAAIGLARLWTRVEDRGEDAAVLGLMQEFDDRIEGISVAADEIAGGSSVAFVRIRRERQSIPLEVLGDGFARALTLACNLVAARDGVLLVDEFDNSLDPARLRDVVTFVAAAARRLAVHVVLSTHNLDTLDAFLDLPTEDGLHVLRLRGANRAPAIRNLDREEARGLRADWGLDLRQAG